MYSSTALIVASKAPFRDFATDAFRSAARALCSVVSKEVVLIVARFRKRKGGFRGTSFRLKFGPEDQRIFGVCRGPEVFGLTIRL